MPRIPRGQLIGHAAIVGRISSLMSRVRPGESPPSPPPGFSETLTIPLRPERPRPTTSAPIMNDQTSPGLPNPLPAAFAFVVQFGAASGPADELLNGRIEHIVSGCQRRFNNAAELLRALQEMLTASRQENGGER